MITDRDPPDATHDAPSPLAPRPVAAASDRGSPQPARPDGPAPAPARFHDPTGALALHLPQDRRRALAEGRDIPVDGVGSALFADLSGFSVLAERLTVQHGPRRGAEELTRALDRVFGALVAEADRREGSVVGFSGDAITAWFPDDDGTRAAWAAIAMRTAIDAIPPLGPEAPPLGIKSAIATGSARRLVVGDPAVRRFDVLAGPTIDRMAAIAAVMTTGEILVDETTAGIADPATGISTWRPDPDDPSRRFALLTRPARPDPAQADPALVDPGPAIPASDPASALPPDAVAGWLPPRVAERLLTGSGALIAELRPAVSLFIGLGGLSLDHPDGAATLDRAVRWIERIVAAEDGTPIDITIGEKGSYLFAVFGAPVAHDDDPERALRAARAIVRPPTDLGLSSAPRVGIARGRVRVGEFGGATRRTYGLQGREVVIAARLMERARPGEVVVSDRVAAAVGSRTRLESLGAIAVKGTAQPVELFRLPTGQATGAMPGPVAAARPVAVSALVGRERELAQLKALAQEAQEATRVAVLVGEPGLGKSRLMEDALAAVARARLLRVGVDPIDRDIPYAGWRPVIAELLDATPATSPDEVRARAADALAPTDRDRLPLLDPVLPAPAGTSDTETTARLDPAARQDETHRLLLALIEARRDGAPLVLAVDDAQWLDSLSWTLLHRAARDVPRLLVLATLRADAIDRDEVRALLTAPGVVRIDLGPLDAAAVTGLARQVLGVEAIPDAVARFIAERGGGNPLHCQELALALRDAGEVVVDGGHARLREGADLAAVAFPESVEGVIGVRLDRLSPRLQDLLKVASVLDGAVRRDDLAALTGAPLPPDALVDLAAADLLAPVIATDAAPEGPAFAFRHALVRSVAYERLLFEQRRELHRRYAEHLEMAAAAGPDAIPDAQLAHHWERAGVVGRAIDHLERAGESAFRDGGFPEAAHLLGRALELDAAAPAARAAAPDATLRIDARRRAGWQWTAAQATYRLGDLQRSRALAEAALAAYDRPLPEGRAATIPVLTSQIGRQVAHRIRPGRFIGRAAGDVEREDLRRATRACFNLAEVYYLAGLQERSALAALRGLNLAERLGPSPELVEAYGAIAIIGSLVGQHGLAARYGRLGRATADTIRDPFASALIAHQLTMSRCGVGPAEPLLTEALAGIDGFRAIGDKGRYRDALGIAASGAWIFGRTALCEIWFRAHIATHAADERSLGLAWAWGWLGAAALRRDDAATALDLLERSMAAETGIAGTDITGTARQGWLALALHRLGLASAAQAEAATWERIRASGGRPAGHPVIDAYLSLWEIVRDRIDRAPNPGARAAAREQARELVGYLDRYRKVYPVGRSPHLRVVGELQDRDGDRVRAMASFRAAIEAARALDQQADLAFAHAALARVLPQADAERHHHRAEAQRLIETAGLAPSIVMGEESA